LGGITSRDRATADTQREHRCASLLVRRVKTPDRNRSKTVLVLIALAIFVVVAIAIQHARMRAGQIPGAPTSSSPRR
jgi:hypothetical protein